MKKTNQFVNLSMGNKEPYRLKDLSEVIDSAYSSVRNKKEFLTKTSFSPSTLGWKSGKCPRRWVLAFQGAEFVNTYSAASIDMMQAGTDAHERMQKNFDDSSLDVVIEYDLIGEDPPIHGFVDLILKNWNDTDVPIEIKTTRKEAFVVRQASNQGKDYHILQLAIYLKELNLQYGFLMYENKNDHQKLLIRVEMTEELSRKMDEVYDWMRLVHKTFQDGDLPKVPYRKNSAVCKDCPLQKWCSEQPEGTVTLPTLPFGIDE